MSTLFGYEYPVVVGIVSVCAAVIYAFFTLTNILAEYQECFEPSYKYNADEFNFDKSLAPAAAINTRDPIMGNINSTYSLSDIGDLDKSLAPTEAIKTRNAVTVVNSTYSLSDIGDLDKSLAPAEAIKTRNAVNSVNSVNSTYSLSDIGDLDKSLAPAEAIKTRATVATVDAKYDADSIGRIDRGDIVDYKSFNLKPSQVDSTNIDELLAKVKAESEKPKLIVPQQQRIPEQKNNIDFTNDSVFSKISSMFSSWWY